VRNPILFPGIAAALVAAALSVPTAQSVRDHTRLKTDRASAITPEQASELTLTVTPVTVRPVQAWIRGAGRAAAARRSLTAAFQPADVTLVKVGQRVRAFAPAARSVMYQGKVTRVEPRGAKVLVTVAMTGQARENTDHYLLEIVATHGELLSVPNEAIIETGETRIVYVQQGEGRFEPREIQIGVQGELYTQILDGVTEGEQVVTLGSFFVDADRKLKGL